MNDTNSVPYLEQILKANDALLGLPALPLVLLLAIALGYVLKFIPIYPNNWIPIGVIAGAMLANVGIAFNDGSGNYARAFIYGLIVGVASIAIHRKWLRDWLDPKMFGDDSTPKPPTTPSSTIVLALSAMIAAASLTGCGLINPEGIKPAAVEAGEDAVVVNAERVQETSLFAYERMIKWETTHRAILPVEVSRAVDQARKTFKPNWEASRVALKEYKKQRGDNIENVHRLTTALSVAQSSFLRLTSDQSSGDIGAIFMSLKQLSEAVQTIKK